MGDAALEYLRTTFGYPDFRLQQGEIIQTLIDGNDAVVLMPTGAVNHCVTRFHHWCATAPASSSRH